MATEYPERHELLEEVRALRRELADSHPPSATDGRVRYQSVVDNVIDGIITIDEGGKIESFNPLPHESSATTAVDFREDLFYRINTNPSAALARTTRRYRPSPRSLPTGLCQEEWDGRG